MLCSKKRDCRSLLVSLNGLFFSHSLIGLYVYCCVRLLRVLAGWSLTFVPDHGHVRHGSVGEGLDNETIPIIQILKAIVVRDVVAHHHGLH